MISARSVSALLMLAALGVLALLVAVTVGSVSMTLTELWMAIAGKGEPLFRELVFSLRLPRALAAFATGGLLALAGALMQVLLRNPLADPYVLGISGGAAVGALASMLLGLGTAMVSGSAFAGALLSTLLVFGLAQGRGSWTPTRLLLTGVVIAAGWGAVITFMLSLSPADRLPGMLYWLMGDLSYARSPWLAWLVLIPVLIVTLPLGRSLNVLARGPLQAAALGVAVKPLAWLVYGLASLLTAVAEEVKRTLREDHGDADNSIPVYPAEVFPQTDEVRWLYRDEGNGNLLNFWTVAAVGGQPTDLDQGRAHLFDLVNVTGRMAVATAKALEDDSGEHLPDAASLLAAISLVSARPSGRASLFCKDQHRGSCQAVFSEPIPVTPAPDLTPHRAHRRLREPVGQEHLHRTFHQGLRRQHERGARGESACLRLLQ